MDLRTVAGNKGVVFTGIVAANTPPSPQTIASLAEYTGRIEELWRYLDVLNKRTGNRARITAAVEAVKTGYFKDVDHLYGSVLDHFAASGESGYALAEFRTKQTAILQTIPAIREAGIAEATAIAAEQVEDARSKLVITAVGMILAAVSIAGTTLLFLQRVIYPLEDISQSVARIAQGERQVETSHHERNDEIGNIARNVKVLVEGLARAEADVLSAERDSANQRAAEERRQTMNGLADNFEASVKAVAQTVAAAAGQITGDAQSMSNVADLASRKAAAVAVASQQATANVEVLATTSEGLASSITEISRQVDQATQISAKAVEQAMHTGEIMVSLSKAAERIGQVVQLIGAIASQTNLLALNATIEAARAGEGGKGFAVVANEVKNLANQTAKATGEIGGEIAAVQAATQEAVQAIDGITGTIRQVSDISATICTAVAQQSAATQEISRNVELATSGSHEVMAHIDDVTRASTEAGHVATQVLSASTDLFRQADILKTEVDKFVTRVRVA
jgi:methyl-accepting chemotaxis protein